MIREGSSTSYSWAELEVQTLVEAATGMRSTAGLNDPALYKRVRGLIALCKAEPPEYDARLEEE